MPRAAITDSSACPTPGSPKLETSARAALASRSAALPCRRIVLRPVEQETAQGPEVRERVDLLLADARRVLEPLASGERFEAACELLDRQAAYVDAVQPLELDLVESRRIAAHALECEALDQLRCGQDRRIVARPPAEQRQI